VSADASQVRSVSSDELTDREREAIRKLLDAAFDSEQDGFTDADWQHTASGRHFLLQTARNIYGHASVVPRELETGGRRLRTGYVEAVAISPGQQRRGLGRRIMLEVSAYIRDTYELGALSTGSNAFYEGLGWRTWKGALFVRTARALEATPDDDGSLMVLTTPRTPPLDLAAPISCEWRPGDVW
jgi:aminoglycoside 2'-N-acetyltransferase I